MNSIRIARPEDWDAIDEICRETGAAGTPIPPERRAIFPELWVRPYQRLYPEWTWVGTRDDRVVGYLTGCPDTPAMRVASFWRHDLLLAWNLLVRRRGPLTTDAARYLRRRFGLESPVEHAFGRDRLDEWDREYPAHLHINFLPEARGAGLGRRLVEAYFTQLREAGVSGVHLYCGEGPVRFYENTGFALLKRIEFRPGAPVFAFGRKT